MPEVVLPSKLAGAGGGVFRIQQRSMRFRRAPFTITRWKPHAVARV